jgi:hypothetical protein
MPGLRGKGSRELSSRFGREKTVKEFFSMRDLLRTYSGALFLAFLFFLNLALPSRLNAAGFSGLEGTQLALKIAADAQADLNSKESATGGRISAVAVSRDTERQLTLSVAFAGLEGKTIEALVRDGAGAIQTEAPSTRAVMDAFKNPRDLTLELKQDLPLNATLESAVLQILVFQPSDPIPSLVYTWQLGKKWKARLDPENVIVHVRPTPVGSAEALARGTGIVGPIHMMQLSPQIYTKLVATNLMIKMAPTPTLAQPKPAATTMLVATNVMFRRAPVMARPLTPVPRATTVPRPAASTAPAVMTMQPMIKLDPRVLKVATFNGVSAEDRNQGAQGPGTSSLYLLEGFKCDVEFDPAQMLNVYPYIFEDKNPSCGIYYFLPLSYHLAWSPDDGYGFKILYQATQPGAEHGTVSMSATLDAGIGPEAVALTTELLKRCLRQYPEKTFKALRPLPIIKKPALSFVGGLEHQYSIPPEHIFFYGQSLLLDKLQFGWITDPITKENIQLSLVENVGLRGDVELSLGDDAAPLVPTRLLLADPTTFGSLPWKRDAMLRNPTPYPIRVRYIHALVLPGDRRVESLVALPESLRSDSPVVYSWDCSSAAPVPPKGRIEWDLADLPKSIDAQAMHMWIEYSVVKDDPSYDTAVIRELTGGVSSFSTAQVTLHSINSISGTGAYEISVKLRSKYFDPQSRELTTKPPVSITEDRKDYNAGTIYLVNRDPGEAKPDDPLLEYRISVAMQDGRTHEATRWFPSNEPRIQFGTYQIKEALGFVPGHE